MENIKIIKPIGTGLFGTTYKVYDTKKNKYYALKQQKILKSFITKGTKYYMWRELKFYKWILKLSKSDQNFFMKMIDYKFYANCSYSNPNQSTAKSKIINRLLKSKHCLDLLLDLKDGTLNDLLKKNKLNDKQFYSMIIQITYICYLLNKSFYVHNDMHWGNITFKKVSHDKIIKIKINEQVYKIKSYGYQWSIIDYGLILHKNFKMTKKEQNTYNNGLLYNKDLKTFFIFALTNIRVLLKKNYTKTKIINKFYKLKPDLYQRIKLLIISLYSSMEKYYDEFEQKNKVKKLLFNEIIQFLAIYDIKFLKQLFKVKDLKKNNISNNHLEFFKLNFNDYESIIKYFINLC